MSVSRHCAFYKVTNGLWYMDLAEEEHGDSTDSTTYGPFRSQLVAEQFLDDNFANPGAFDIDERGTREVPTISPNGNPVVHPSRINRW